MKAECLAILELDPTDVPIFGYCMNLSLSENEMKKILFLIVDAKNADPNNAQLIYSQAYILWKFAIMYNSEGKYEQALVAVNNAIRFGEESGLLIGQIRIFFQLIRGVILMNLNNKEEAIDSFTAVIESGVNNKFIREEALNYRSILLAELGRYADALLDLDRMRSEGMEEKILGKLFNRRIAILENMGKYREALAEIERERPRIGEMNSKDRNKFDILEEKLNDALSHTLFQE